MIPRGTIVAPDNPIRFTEAYVSAFKETLCRPDTGEWRQDALAALTVAIDVEGCRVREANPCSALIYARLATLTVKYLSVRPNNNGRRYLRYRLDRDMAALAKVVHPELTNTRLAYYVGCCFRGRDLLYLESSYIMCQRLKVSL